MRLLPVLIAASLLPGVATAATDYEREIETLRNQVRQRDAEIAALRRDIATLRHERPQNQASTTPLQRQPEIPPGPNVPPRPPPSPQPTADDEEVLATALETALVRQGGRVLSQGAIEIEPELSYFYDEPVQNQRRDHYGAALTARFGLPWSTQIEVRLPYAISDHWTGVGTSSGIGDIRVGLTTELVSERELVPALLGLVQWRTTTGDINRDPPTGFGQNAIVIGLTAMKRHDPIVLLGSVFYTANLGSAHLRTGATINAGDVFGGRLSAFLAVTPDTSLQVGISANSFSADRFDSTPDATSDRLRASLELGVATTLGRNLFLNVTAGIGITPAAPNFSLVASMPYRF
jgi:hypothetical protein